MRPVAITGLGASSALGSSAEELFSRLCAGESGLGPARRGAARGPVAAIPGGPVYAPELAIAAARQALTGGAEPRSLEPRSLEPRSLDLRGLAVIGASTAGDMARSEPAVTQHIRDGATDRPDEYFWPQRCHVPTAAVARALGAEGPCYTLSTACTSGTCAIADAGELVAAGIVPAALAVGVDALCDLTLAGFGALKVYAPEPTRPFDADRRGMNIGEGAAALLLEDLDHALARGARPLALLAGHGNSSDAHHLSTPDPTADGARRAIRMALGELPASAVGYVNAHATGTLLNDAMEAQALAAEVPEAAVSGSKGAIGHTLGGAGALEAVITILALTRGRLPPNVGLRQPGFDLDLVRACREVRVEAALSVNFAFGGHNAAVLFTAWRG